MPFKMMSPLKRMATTAIKKMKDLSGDGKVTQKDVLIGRGVINPDGTKVKTDETELVELIKTNSLETLGMI